MNDNQQIIVEHIVNIDTVAQHIDTVDAVAGVAGQIAAVAGMLPDIAATAQARATIIALSKKLTEITAVSEALPLLHALQAMTEQVTAVIALRPELAAVVGQMSAIQSLAAELDTLMQAPAYAERSEAAAGRAEVGAASAESFAGKADMARLGAEFAETETKAARDIAVTAKGASEAARDDARKAAAAAEAVSGLPDASLAAPGDPLIWSGAKFAVGTLAESLVSVDGALGVAPAVLTSIDTAKATADGAVSSAAQAQEDATSAKTIAEGVDGKATQAQTDATAAKTAAEAAGALAGSFDGRLTAAETETMNVGVGLSAHAGTSDIHTPKADIEAVAEAAVNRLKDGDNGAALPADRDTLLKLSGIIDEVGGSLADFLGGEEPGKRMAILTELDRLSAELSGLSTGGLTRADVVNALDSQAQDAPLAAAQGPVLKQMVDAVRTQAENASRAWVGVLDATAPVPETWPDSVQTGGLLVRFAYSAEDGIRNPEWYIGLANRPMRLTTDASGIRLADGTTVQSAVGQIKIDAAQASAAAASAAALAAQAQTDAAEAKTIAEGVDGKATQAQTDAAAAKATAEGVDAKATAAQTAASEAKTIAESVDAKATQAQTDATAAQTAASEAKATAAGVDAKATQALEDAAEALAKSPDLATQTTPGIVKGSETVRVHEDGSITSAAFFVGQMADIPTGISIEAGWYAMNGGLYPLSTPQGQILDSFSEDFKTAFGIRGGTAAIPEDVYPQMTSDTTPAPLKSKLSVPHWTNCESFRLFDKSDDTVMSTTNKIPQGSSVSVYFSSGVPVPDRLLISYAITSWPTNSSENRYPQEWNIYAGLSPDFDVDDFSLIATEIENRAIGNLESHMYTVPAPALFGKLRFDFKMQSETYLTLAQLKLYTLDHIEIDHINLPDWNALYPATPPLQNLQKYMYLGAI